MVRIGKDLENLKKLNNLFLAPLFINDDPFTKVLQTSSSETQGLTVESKGSQTGKSGANQKFTRTSKHFRKYMINILIPNLSFLSRKSVNRPL